MLYWSCLLNNKFYQEDIDFVNIGEAQHQGSTKTDRAEVQIGFR